MKCWLHSQFSPISTIAASAHPVALHRSVTSIFPESKRYLRAYSSEKLAPAKADPLIAGSEYTDSFTMMKNKLSRTVLPEHPARFGGCAKHGSLLVQHDSHRHP